MFYGQSQPPEDKIAAALFGDTIGTFCEVGAFNGKDLSNTMYFYERGWPGINFEPHPDNYAALCENQPEAINIRAAVGMHTDELVTIKTTPNKPIVTGFDLPKWYIKDEVPGGEAGLVDMHVPLITLDYAFGIHGVDRVDYISIDTDGTELTVLRGVSLSLYHPRLIVLEYNASLSQIDDYLAMKNYQRAYMNGINAFYVRTNQDAWTINEAVINDR